MNYIGEILGEHLGRSLLQFAGLFFVIGAGVGFGIGWLVFT